MLQEVSAVSEQEEQIDASAPAHDQQHLRKHNSGGDEGDSSTSKQVTHC